MVEFRQPGLPPVLLHTTSARRRSPSHSWDSLPTAAGPPYTANHLACPIVIRGIRIRQLRGVRDFLHRLSIRSTLLSRPPCRPVEAKEIIKACLQGRSCRPPQATRPTSNLTPILVRQTTLRIMPALRLRNILHILHTRPNHRRHNYPLRARALGCEG